MELDDKTPTPSMPLDSSIHDGEILDEVLKEENAEIFDSDDIAELALCRVPSHVYLTRDIETVRYSPCLFVDEQHDSAISKDGSNYPRSNGDPERGSESGVEFKDDFAYTNDLVQLVRRLLAHLRTDGLPAVQQIRKTYNRTKWLGSRTMATTFE